MAAGRHKAALLSLYAKVRKSALGPLDDATPVGG